MGFTLVEILTAQIIHNRVVCLVYYLAFARKQKAQVAFIS